MKRHIMHITMMLLTAASMVTISCTKDDPNPGDDPNPEPHGRMYGTDWVKTYKDFSLADEGYYEDHLYIYFCTATLRFLDNRNGERTLGKDIYDEIQHETVEHLSDTTILFTYAYNGGSSLFGPGMIYWDNGDSTKFYVQGTEENQRIYMESEDFPDNSLPIYYLTEK